MMQFTYVVRPGEAPEGRGPQFEPFWTVLMNFSLRAGFLFQLLSFVGLSYCVSRGSRNSNLSLLELLRADPEFVGGISASYVMFFCAMAVFGHLLIMSFLHITDDDSSIKQSRGFRAGTKFLTQGTLLGSIGWVFALISFYAMTNYTDDPWIRGQIGEGSQWLVFYSSRACEMSSLFLYSAAIFFLETFHSEGAGEIWGWITALLFKLTALTELIGLTMCHEESFHVADTVYTILLGISLVLAFFWAIIFEPISHRFDVKLTQSALRNEYYKSRNAMAYYGPATVDATGELDLSMLPDQAQSCFNCQNC